MKIWIVSLDAPDSQNIFIICGPTASGKTSVALRMAQQLPVEIISADSRQIIRDLDIGTAKPTADEQRACKFHLIDIIEIGEKYSAYRFLNDADRLIGEIQNRDHIPLIVGGTGLYLKALTDGVAKVEQGESRIRDELELEMERIGPDAMHQRLTEIDPESAAAIHPNNKVRTIRALEIFKITGKTKSELLADGAYLSSRHSFEYHCLLPDREDLYDRINKRVDVMLESGLLGEFQALIDAGRAADLRRANVIGYQELLDWHENKCYFNEAVEAIKQNSRRFAKRQITWFKHQIEADFYPNEKAMQDVLLKRRI